ncbi:MAG: DMT family transporter [Anaerolineales bacterium]|uniref:DMT family transporter n=1 Tax=Candidatus Villigracilis vicinus TaxID=3140679 RepID=UPI003136840B|nr:DMT family transporter [Anaerolineales bacterium]
MDTLFIIILIGLAGGMAIGLQGPLSSMITQKLGSLESVFIIHLGGAIAALIPMLFFGSKLGQWKSVPWYALVAGAFGLIVITAMGYMIPRIGAAGALITLLAGQILVASFLDHFGLLGMTPRAIDLQRIIGFGVVMVGVWLTVR